MACPAPKNLQTGYRLVSVGVSVGGTAKMSKIVMSRSIEYKRMSFFPLSFRLVVCSWLPTPLDVNVFTASFPSGHQLSTYSLWLCVCMHCSCSCQQIHPYFSSFQKKTHSSNVQAPMSVAQTGVRALNA